MKVPCDICDNEIEVEVCCDGFMCGCMGIPIEPPVCSEDCLNKYMDKIHNSKPTVIRTDRPHIINSDRKNEITSFKELIKCPSCSITNIATVEVKAPFNSYVHECYSCKYVIMESEWELVNEENK